MTSCDNATRLAFRLNYGPNEASYLACALADVAAASGLEIVFLTSGNRKDGVHELWDQYVEFMPVPDSRSWPQGLSDVVWFNVHGAELLTTRRAGLRNILVTANVAISTNDLPDFDTVVALSQESWRNFSGAEAAVRLIPACGSYPRVSRSATVRDGLFLLDGRTLRKFGYGLIHTAGLLLEECPELSLTLLCLGGWPAATGKLISHLGALYGSRLTLVKNTLQQERLNLYARHGWVFHASCCDTTGLLLTDALAASSAVAAFNYGLPGEILHEAGFGWRIDCGTVYNQNGLLEADVDCKLVRSSLRAFYAQLQLGYDPALRQRADDYLNLRRSDFVAGWKSLWGVS